MGSEEKGFKQFKFLDKTVGAKCLASILGVGHSRLRKAVATTPDLRYGKRGGYTSKAGTFSVDGFLRILYDSVAETLPDRPVCPIFFH